MTTRRAHHEGNIYHRKDGRWQGSLSAGSKNGKRYRPVVYGGTRGEVVQKLNRLKIEMTVSKYRESNALTVSAFLNFWLEQAIQRETSKDYYGTLIRCHIEPKLGRLQLRKVSPAVLDAFFAELRRQNVKPFAVQASYDTLRWALRVAVSSGLLLRNPLESISRPSAFPRTLTFLTPQQIPVFLAAAKDDRQYAMYVLGVLYGLRQGELFGLAEEDFDFNTGTVTIKRTVQLVRGRRSFGNPKSLASRRTLKLSRFVLDAVREHIATLNDSSMGRSMRRCHGLDRVDSGPITMLFLNKRGRLLSRSAVRQHSFQPILRRAGLPPMKFHALRHSAATLLLSQGHSIVAVARTLGHSRPSLTLDIYGKYLSDEGERIACRLDEFVFSFVPPKPQPML